MKYIWQINNLFSTNLIKWLVKWEIQISVWIGYGCWQGIAIYDAGPTSRKFHAAISVATRPADRWRIEKRPGRHFDQLQGCGRLHGVQNVQGGPFDPQRFIRGGRQVWNLKLSAHECIVKIAFMLQEIAKGGRRVCRTRSLGGSLQGFTSGGGRGVQLAGEIFF
jgi:hypothetical protein